MYAENNSELLDLDLKDIIQTHVPNFDECLSEFLDSIFENEVLKTWKIINPQEAMDILSNFSNSIGLTLRNL